MKFHLALKYIASMKLCTRLMTANCSIVVQQQDRISPSVSLCVSSSRSFALAPFLFRGLKFDNQLTLVSSGEGKPRLACSNYKTDDLWQHVRIKYPENQRIKYTGCARKQKNLFKYLDWPKPQRKIKPKLCSGTSIATVMICSME